MFKKKKTARPHLSVLNLRKKVVCPKQGRRRQGPSKGLKQRPADARKPLYRIFRTRHLSRDLRSKYRD